MCYLYDDNKWSTVHVIIFYCACIIFPDDDQAFPIDLVFKHGFSLQNVYLTMAYLLIPSRQIIYQMSMYILLSVFFWQLCCLFFFVLQILITHLVYLNSSYVKRTRYAFSNIVNHMNIPEDYWNNVQLRRISQ